MAVALDVTSTPVNNITVSNPATSGTLGPFTCASGSVLIVTSFWEDSNSGVKPTITGITDNSGASNAWQKYKRYTRAFTNGYGGAHNDVEEIWWTVSTSSWSGKTVTVTYDSSGDDAALQLSAWSGCNTSSPFDANASLGVQVFYDSVTQATETFSAISTNQSAGMLIGVQGTSVLLSTGVNFANSGWTQVPSTTLLVNSGNNWSASVGMYYQSFSSQVSSQSYTPCSQAAVEWYSILFALVPPGAVTTPTWGFEQTHPPPYFRTKQVTPFKGDDGIEAPFIRYRPYGWEIQPPQPPHPRSEKSGSIQAGDTGIEAPFIFIPPPKTWGFEQTNPSPYYRNKTVTPFKGDDGIEFPYINFHPAGWEIQPPQPSHPKPERAASILAGDTGIEAPFINFHPYGWEPPPPPLLPHPFIEKRGNSLRGDDGIQSPYINFHPAGWEIQPPQPPHPFYEKRGSILKGDDGIEAPYTFISSVSIIDGWEIQLIQPRYRLNRSQVLSEEGIEFPFVPPIVIPPVPFGWEPQGYQPKHPRSERVGSIMVGDQGNQGIYTYVPPPPITLHPGWFIRMRHIGRR